MNNKMIHEVSEGKLEYATVLIPLFQMTQLRKTTTLSRTLTV
jgi:hypothetical protein